MAQVCLVWEEGGCYDSQYKNVILIYKTLAEGEAAVLALNAELKALKRIPDTRQRFNHEWNACAPNQSGTTSYRAEDRAPLWDELTRAYEAEVRAVLKVYPCDTILPDGRVVLNTPSISTYDDVTFYASMMSLSSLKSSG